MVCSKRPFFENHRRQLTYPALILALAYLYAQDNPDALMTLTVITLRAKWLPLALLLTTFVMESPRSALHQLMGLVAAHLYDFVTRIWPTFGGGRNPIKTPQFVRRWFVADASGAAPTTKAYGTAFTSNAAPAAGQGTSRGVSSGFGGFGSSWGGRGAGRRLGGE